MIENRKRQFKRTYFKYKHMNIKFVLLCRYSTEENICFLNLTRQKQLRQFSQEITLQMKQMKTKVNDMIEIKTNDGFWYSVYDQNDIVYTILTDLCLLDHYAIDFIKKIQIYINKIPSSDNQTFNEFKCYIKRKIKLLVAAYNDQNTQKISKIFEKEQEIKDYFEEFTKLDEENPSSCTLPNKEQQIKQYQKFLKAVGFKKRSYTKTKIFIALSIFGLIVCGGILLVMNWK